MPGWTALKHLLPPSCESAHEHHRPQDHAAILAQALPYLQQYQGKTMVIKYGGNAMMTGLQRALRGIVLLQLLGIRPVVVHGAARR